MKLVIVLHHRFDLWTPPAWVAERLRRDFPNVEIKQFEDYAEAESDLADADAVVTWSLRPEQVALAKKLRWIHSPAAAVHQFMIPEIVNSDIVLTHASTIHAPVVAEHAIALMLALAKSLPSAVRYQQKHVWAQQQLWDERPHPREVAGATLGIVGLGSIGTEIAARALCLGMRIIATRQHPERGVPETLTSSAARNSVTVLGPSGMGALLSQSDYVVLCAPLRPSTKALIDASMLSLMKPDACIINVGRGSLIDEAALANALKERRIGGAALDVFETEPLPPDSPLWDLTNVLITPHSAAMTDNLWERHYKMISGNLRRFLAGQSLVGVVDTRRGY
jgi:phosphoglycerate dehydrogenase-like enzyme